MSHFVLEMHQILFLSFNDNFNVKILVAVNIGKQKTFAINLIHFKMKWFIYFHSKRSRPEAKVFIHK